MESLLYFFHPLILFQALKMGYMVKFVEPETSWKCDPVELEKYVCSWFGCLNNMKHSASLFDPKPGGFKGSLSLIRIQMSC